MREASFKGVSLFIMLFLYKKIQQNKYVVSWTMPLFFGGTIGTGSIMGGLLQIVWLLIDIVIYAPFVIAGNKVKDEYEEE